MPVASQHSLGESTLFKRPKKIRGRNLDKQEGDERQGLPTAVDQLCLAPQNVKISDLIFVIVPSDSLLHDVGLVFVCLSATTS
jgi:hypothetical protein